MVSNDTFSPQESRKFGKVDLNIIEKHQISYGGFKYNHSNSFSRHNRRSQDETAIHRTHTRGSTSSRPDRSKLPELDNNSISASDTSRLGPA